MTALEDFRDIAIEPPAPGLIYQLREEGEDRILFLGNTSRTEPVSGRVIRVKGSWLAEEFCTLSGSTRQAPRQYRDGWTEISHDFPAHGSLLLRLRPGKAELLHEDPPTWKQVPNPFTTALKFELDEPNVLLLDQARFRIGDGDWQDAEETLRIENRVRAELGLRTNDGQLAQPWTEPGLQPTLAVLELEFEVVCKVPVTRPSLAIEQAAETEIFLNGEPVQKRIEGYFVDESIATLPLPDLAVGVHKLVLKRPFTRRSTVEWCYLLGFFGVQVEGRRAHIVEMSTTVKWGDWTTQGLPFYGGNLTYIVPLSVGEGRYKLRFDSFKAPLLQVSSGDKDTRVAFAPFEAEIDASDELRIKAFGSRINTFGQVHCKDPNRQWFGPDSWRTTGETYSYEYQLKPCGILEAPSLFSTT